MVTNSMLFRIDRNWKKRLSSEDESKLNDLIERSSVHRSAYLVAEDVEIAQLWCALVEMKKETSGIRERISKIEYLLEGFTSRAVSMESGKRDVIESHERF